MAENSAIQTKPRRGEPGWVHPMKGKTYSPEVRARMGRKKGCANPHRRGPRSPEERARISAGARAKALRGPACPAFKDGKLAERRDARFSGEYKRWRFDVFSRDRFACRHCGDARGGNLHAHHIKPFATHPELRFEVSNGLTLCEPCHKAVHAAGRQLDGVQHDGYPT